MDKYSLEDIQSAMGDVMGKYPKLCGKDESEISVEKRIISKGFNLLIDAMEGHLPKI